MYFLTTSIHFMLPYSPFLYLEARYFILLEYFLSTFEDLRLLDDFLLCLLPKEVVISLGITKNIFFMVNSMEKRKSNPKRRWERALSNSKIKMLLRNSWNVKNTKQYYKDHLKKKL